MEDGATVAATAASPDAACAAARRARRAVGGAGEAAAPGARSRPRARRASPRSLADGRDRKRRVDAEARRHDRGVHAVQPLVAEHLADVVDDPEADLVGHPRAAERVRCVHARGLGELQEPPHPAPLGDPLDLGVGPLADPRRLLPACGPRRPAAPGASQARRHALEAARFLTQRCSRYVAPAARGRSGSGRSSTASGG